MAKSKKQDGTEKSAAPAGGTDAGAAKKRTTRTKPDAQPKASAKGGARKVTSPGTHHFPLIDTSLAASAAASMVMHRAGGGASQAGGTGTGSASTTPTARAAEGAGDAGDAGDKRETSTFKQLKQSLNKPASQGLAGILGNSQAGKKTTQTFSGPNQVRRNQTFGADASRTNVPRRTGG